MKAKVKEIKIPRREQDMKRIILLTFLAFVLALCLASQTQAVVMNFDDIASGTVPSGYMGFTWYAPLSSWAIASNSWYNTTYSNTETYTSPSNAAFNGGGSSSAYKISNSSSDFAITGAYFSSFTVNDTYASWSAKSLLIEGYKDGSKIGNKTVSLGTDLVWNDVNLGGFVDELRFTASGSSGGSNNYWIMDNFTYVVPIPPSMILLGSGLLGLGLLGLRRKRN